MSYEQKLITAVRGILKSRGKTGTGSLIKQLQRQSFSNLASLWKLLADMEQRGEARRSGPADRAFWELTDVERPPSTAPKPRRRIPASTIRHSPPSPPPPDDFELEDPATFAPEHRISPDSPASPPPDHLQHISRVDHPRHHTHGFFVRVTRNGQLRQKFFSDKKLGSRAQALAAALSWRDQTIAAVGGQLKPPIAGEPGRSNTGVAGVSLIVRGEHMAYQATWRDPSGRLRRTTVSIDRHGQDAAMAVALAKIREGQRQA
ncbi:hypothetical protein K2Z83_20300 [Oscillochloris sp. ZM17-4]|uniref:hypothetical protein n=1 Tax=Oscillochloris sp. ZM17-4 TaxID=2866714 RepID=UPI001C72BCB5|nr:hypothetical protein [Oscillochloris sp. ZM17-4]MBX0330013.1 hypothetical protein [Oscillochloris sp. ZM17-4]